MTGRRPRRNIDDSSLDVSAGFPCTLSRGRAFVYVVACRDDNLLKIGFTRDPWSRWRALHSRFFDLFDLGNGILISTDQVKDARNLEAKLIGTFADYSALASPMARPSAGGHTEWFRGVNMEAMNLAKDLASRNAWDWQSPADWLRSFLAERIHLLFSWTTTMLEVIEFEQHNEGVHSGQVASLYESALRDALDAFQAVGLNINDHLPNHVRRWHRECR